MARLGRDIEELREYRSNLLERARSARGWTRLMRNLNLFLLTEKQMQRHLRFMNLQYDALHDRYRKLQEREQESRSGQSG